MIGSDIEDLDDDNDDDEQPPSSRRSYRTSIPLRKILGAARLVEVATWIEKPKKHSVRKTKLKKVPNSRIC